MVSLLKVKYKDKKYLCAYDLNVELFDMYNLQVEDVIPLRSVYILDTPTGKKILKRIDYSKKRLDFICKSLDYVKQSFDHIMTIEKCKDGTSFVQWKNGLYIILGLIEGRESAFSNQVDLYLASKALGELHNASLGLFECIGEAGMLEDNVTLNNLSYYFDMAYEDLIKFKDQVGRYGYKNDFDKLYMDNVDYYLKQISECKQLLDMESYSKVCKDPSKIVLCHNDLAHHNILIKDNEAYFIDFDYCTIDIRVKDLATFILKSIKNFSFNIEKCKEILKVYNEVALLDKSEYELIYILLRFPYDFYTCTRDYYYKKKDWGEDIFLYKLLNKLEFEEDREDFLEKFRLNILDIM